MNCNRCGKCCVSISVPGVDYLNIRTFLSKYPFLVHVGPRWGPYGQMVPMFNCLRLVNDDQVHSCLEYDSRPNFCKEFPEIGQVVPNTCVASVEVEVS